MVRSDDAAPQSDVASGLPIAAMPRDGLIWEVVAHGRLLPGDDGSLVCEVLLARSDWRRLDAALAVPTCVAMVPMRLLPSLEPGGVWKDGLRTDGGASPTFETVEVEPGGVGSYRMGPTVSARGWPAHPIGVLTGLPYLTVRTVGGGNLCVPAFELLQAWFATDALWLAHMAEGRWSDPDPARRLVDADAATPTSGPGGAMVIRALAVLTDDQLRVAARWLGSPTGSRAYRAVADRVVRDGWAGGALGSTPFVGRSVWSCRVEWTTVAMPGREPLRLRMATRVTALEVERPYGSIEVREVATPVPPAVEGVPCARVAAPDLLPMTRRVDGRAGASPPP